MRDLGQVAYPLGASVMVRLLCPPGWATVPSPQSFSQTLISVLLWRCPLFGGDVYDVVTFRKGHDLWSHK